MIDASDATTTAEILADIPVFVAAVEAGGFAPAGQRLNLSRSAVARTVARLERRLGARLLHRTTRRLTLTEEGHMILDHGRRALGEVGAARATLESGRREVGGRLRVSVPILFGRMHVLPILTRLVAAHPRLQLDVNFSDRLVDVTEDGFDLAIRNGRLGDLPGLVHRRIALQQMRVCAAPHYLAAHGAPTAIADLHHHTAVLYGRPGHVRSWLFPSESGPDSEIVPPSRLRFDDVGAIFDAAMDGCGLAWLPFWLIRDAVAAGRLVLVLEHTPSHAFESHALWPQSPAMPLRVRLAIDALAAELPRLTRLTA